jgi:hypothetical protein
MSPTTIYMYLLDEGTDVWRPVQAEHLADNCYRILSVNNSPEDEQWQFQTGDIVRCELKQLDGGARLVALSRASV